MICSLAFDTCEETALPKAASQLGTSSLVRCLSFIDGAAAHIANTMNCVYYVKSLALNAIRTTFHNVDSGMVDRIVYELCEPSV